MIHWIPVKKGLKEKTEIHTNQEHIHNHVCAPIQLSISSKPPNLCPNDFSILFSCIFNSEAAHMDWTCLFILNSIGHPNKAQTFISLKHAVSLICCFGFKLYLQESQDKLWKKWPHVHPIMSSPTLLRSWAAKLPLMQHMDAVFNQCFSLTSRELRYESAPSLKTKFVCYFLNFGRGRLVGKIVLKYSASHRIY